jgi:hypothetical protein
MIDLAKIIEKIEARLADLGTTAAEISAKATDSKDTIRNWRRAVDADRANGTDKASATTIKLNQIEKALGIELARNGSGATSETQLRSALLSYGVDGDDLDQVVGIIDTFARAEKPEQNPSPVDARPASRRRVKAPSG